MKSKFVSISYIWMFVAAILICGSCQNIESYKDTDEYSFIPLTQTLISELGGIDSLYKYQFYLSNSFELVRLENEKSPTDKGYVDDLDSNFKVIFNIHTPGILKSTYKTKRGNDCLEILFDKNNNDYLTFCSIKESSDYNAGYFYHVDVDGIIDFAHDMDLIKDDGKFYLDNEKRYEYKGVSWYKKMGINKLEIIKRKISKEDLIDETYLIIRIKKSRTNETEEAKGRTI